MEKAKLMIKETKAKKLIAELQFIETGKTMPFQDFKPNNASLNNVEVEVERLAGKIVRVQHGEQQLYPTAASQTSTKPSTDRQRPSYQPRSSRDANRPDKTPEPERPVLSDARPMQIAHVEHVQHPASAPYSFIPLNEKVVEVTTPIPPCNQYDPERHTGWIDLEIETKTPLYIRDTLTREELDEQAKIEEENKKNKTKKRSINPDFFSPAGKIRIPGSSLRGMIRNLVEIVSFGKFGAFDDRRLYFRGLADISNLRKEYQDRMSSFDRNSRRPLYKMSAGVLRKQGLQYVIVPSVNKFDSIPKDNLKQLKQSSHPIIQDAHFKVYNHPEGYLVESGNMQNKKRDWLIKPPFKEEQKIEILPEDVYSYVDDRTRAAASLIEIANKTKKEVPCFYVLWKDDKGRNRVSFGHTAMFRLAYEKTIDDHIPLHLKKTIWKITKERLEWIRKDELFANNQEILQKLKELIPQEFDSQKEFERRLKEDVLKGIKHQNAYQQVILKHTQVFDIAEAIFGNESLFPGRVFFEDALCEQQKPEEVLLGIDTPKILSSPKPTTFQHYLVQNSDNSRNLFNYNSPQAAIRGYKLYWHKSGKAELWQEDKKILEKLKKEGKDDSQHTAIRPVKPNVKFKGRIRFENLTDIELGALLFTLALPEGCYHKLGMGKPLGLGSVNVTPTLYLSSRKERYQHLFAEWENAPAEMKQNTYFDAFQTSVLNAIGQTQFASLWQTDRLERLEAMLNYQKGLALESEGITRYMNITPQNEFKTRPILPLPDKSLPTESQDRKVSENIEVKRSDEKTTADDVKKNDIAPSEQVYIKDVEIIGLWGKYDISWKNLDPKVNVLIGINGSGKSTMLRVLYCFLDDKEFFPQDRVNLKNVKITFDTGFSVEYQSPYRIPLREILDTCYISTFDAPNAPNEESSQTVGNYFGKQLTLQLSEQIAKFYRYEKTQEEQKKVSAAQGEIGQREWNEFVAQKKQLIDLINLLFKETGKTVDSFAEKINDNGETFAILNFRQDEQLLTSLELSSGEKQMLVILFQVVNQVLSAKQQPCLILMDEPEISLHVEWQEELIDKIQELNSNAQLIVATHSPSIPLKSWFGQMTDIATIVRKGKL